MLANLKPIRLDLLLAVVLTGLTLATLASFGAGAQQWPAYVLAVLTAAPIALRQLAPVTTMAILVAALGLYTLLGYGDFPNSGIGLLVGMFTVAMLRSREVAALVFAGTMVVVGLACLRMSMPVVWSEVAQTGLVVLGAWTLGEGTKRWSARSERLAEEAVQAVANERVRIARELHDVVAHHMSVISLQAGLAQYVLDSDLATARQALATVGDTSREALTEMRRLLDVLRVDQSDEYQPQPGLAALDELVARARGAGLPVETVVTGRARPLPPGPDLCAYRVAQESLTNVLKHAGPATARIDLDYGESTLTLKVTDTGAKPAAQQVSTTSHGIRGMKERAELYGGVLTAGPGRGGGFSVVLRLPMSEER
ncbi:sensor histidine kinase [Saccharothrix coeruleofusca]|uniref:sensor histidine kinase n=1 Tax=Saccharothrix coeruleofusca TaxID=33919 RepID=UPI001E5C2640|nr:sensor histidine kinase [Saccharothrix coeruleofusca]MBP2336891.1 signal transduction histidine kinase [Saccharothrix coeruleofusca]